METPFAEGIAFTDPPGAEDLVNHDSLALLIAMLLDQQITIEWAFRGPARLAERLGGSLAASDLATMELEALTEAMVAKPAVHRYPAVMAGRIQALCDHLATNWSGDASLLWSDDADAATVFERLLELPGFGPEKARITLAVLAKRFGTRPSGWVEAAAPFSDDQPRSVADVGGPDDLARLRAHRKAQKAAGRTKAD